MSKRTADFQMIKDGPEDHTGMADQGNAPSRATAAQLANRRIKSIPKRRQGSPAASSSQPSFNPNPAPSSFNFGSSQPAAPTGNGFAFGGLASSSHAAQSFPPTNGSSQPNSMSAAQSFGGFGASSGAPSNPFASSSFGAPSGGFSFGTSSQGVSNPFSSLASPTTNGGGQSAAPVFQFSTTTSSPSPSANVFGGFGASSGTAAPSTSAGTSAPGFSFGTTSSAPTASPTSSTTMFSSKFAPATSTPSSTPASTGFTFGATSSFPAVSTAPAATEQKPLFAFGSSSTSTPSPVPAAVDTTPKSSFSFGTTSASPAANPTAVDSAQKSLFSFGTSSASPSAASPAPPSAQKPLFAFGTPSPASTPKAEVTTQSPLPAFGTPATGKDSTPATPSFSFGTPSASSTGDASKTKNATPKSPFTFGTPSATNTEQSPSAEPTPKPNFSFSNGTTSKQSTPAFGSASEEAPKPTFSFGQPATPSPGLSSSSHASPFAASQTTSTSASTSKPVQATSSPAGAAVAKPTDQPKAISKPVNFVSSTNTNNVYKYANITGYAHPDGFDAAMSEDNINIPTGVTDSKERAMIMRDAKISRLNESIQQYMVELASQVRSLRVPNYAPVFLSYVELFETISKDYQKQVGERPDAYVPPGNLLKTQVTNQNGSTSQKPNANTSVPAPSKWAPPSSSSETAKKFGAFLNESTSKASEAPREERSTTPESSPVKSNIFGNAGSTPYKAAAAPATSKPAGFTPTFGSSGSSTSTSNPSGFTPTGFTPSAPTSAPTFKTGGGTNFLAQFGQKAALTAEEEKKKRKAEDFDSDEDDEEEWERKYDEEQRAKKQKFEEERAKYKAAPAFVLKQTNSDKSTDAGQGFSRSVSPASSVLDGPRPTGGFGLFSNISDTGSRDDDDDEADDEDTLKPKTNGTGGKSLFSRISPRESPSPADPEDSNPGDHTWKPSTPIKFSSNSTLTPATTAAAANQPKFNFPAPSSAPPKSDSSENRPFGNLFGANAQKTNATPTFSFGKSLAPPSGTSSPFTSVDTSRASTPLESDAGSNAGSAVGAADDDDESATPAEPSSDLVNFEAAKVGHDVLFEVARAKCLRYEQDADKLPTPGNHWVPIGTGPIAVLKNTESNVVSIFMKSSPGGKIVINTRLNAKFDYKQVGKRARFSIIGNAGMESLLVQFSAETHAKEFVEACEQNKK